MFFLLGLVIHKPSFLYEIKPKERVALVEQSQVAHYEASLVNIEKDSP